MIGSIAIALAMTLSLAACAVGSTPPTAADRPQQPGGSRPADTASPSGKPAPIVVAQPVPGGTITSPVTISGTANVFEATVSIRILDASGTPLKETFTTATCGSGCRGHYSTDVEFEVAKQQRGTIEVFESSAKDGSALHLVRVPVMLAP